MFPGQPFPMYQVQCTKCKRGYNEIQNTYLIWERNIPDYSSWRLRIGFLGLIMGCFDFFRIFSIRGSIWIFGGGALRDDEARGILIILIAIGRNGLRH